MVDRIKGKQKLREWVSKRAADDFDCNTLRNKGGRNKALHQNIKT